MNWTTLDPRANLPTSELDSWELPTFDETRLRPSGTRQELPPGLRIGPYAIERELGRGGMGTVYLAARADDAFEKKVAIKVTRGTLASPEALERFKRERQILAGNLKEAEAVDRESLELYERWGRPADAARYR